MHHKSITFSYKRPESIGAFANKQYQLKFIFPSSHLSTVNKEISLFSFKLTNTKIIDIYLRKEKTNAIFLYY